MIQLDLFLQPLTKPHYLITLKVRKRKQVECHLHVVKQLEFSHLLAADRDTPQSHHAIDERQIFS